MVIEERLIQEIPVLVGFEPTEVPRPLVILSHGFTRSKEDWREHIPDLVARGFLVAALDNRGHGDRPGPDFHSRADRGGKWEVLAIRKMMEETAEDIQAVVEALLRQRIADGERIGIAGVSMGAFAGLKAMILDRRIGTVISNIGSPYWDDYFKGTIEEKDSERYRILKTYAADRQPASFPDRFFPRAVLFQVGAADPHLNVGRVRDFARRLEKYYAAAPDRTCYREFPGTAHEFTPSMWAHTQEWLERFL